MHKFTYLSIDYTFVKNVNTAAKEFFSIILKLYNLHFLYCFYVQHTITRTLVTRTIVLLSK
jgi:hypothetical protein